MFFKIVVALIIGYLFGCIPTSVIISKISGHKLEKSTTTTEVLRQIGVKYALIALAIEVLKGILAALIGLLVVGAEYGALGTALGGLAVMLGHVFNPVYGFNGPRGIAPYGGVLIMLCWWLGILAVLLGAVVFAGIKVHHIVALIATLVMAILVSVFVHDAYAIIYAWLTLGFTVLINVKVFKGFVAEKPISRRVR